jgi:ribosomal protein S18 acetylase RimI-like enzyme
MEDKDILTEMSRTTFIDAFEKDNNPEDFKRYIAKAFSNEQMTSELLNPNSLFYFMLLDTIGYVGYVKLNRRDAQKEQFDIDAVELERIYVLKEFQGNKLGQEALELVVDIVKHQKASCLWLGVWEQNLRAISFYENNGFIKFDRHPYLIGDDEQYDWMMKLDLSRSA